MDSSDPNGAHAQLPRLLVSNLQWTAETAAGGGIVEFDLWRLFVDNIWSLAGEQWVPQCSVRLSHILSGLARSEPAYKYVEVEPPRRADLKGKYAWVAITDLKTLKARRGARALARAERQLGHRSA